MYATDRQTDVRQRDVRQKHRCGGGGIIIPCNSVRLSYDCARRLLHIHITANESAGSLHAKHVVRVLKALYIQYGGGADGEMREGDRV